MKKFSQILFLLFAIFIGYGLGQYGSSLWATDYPGGGGGTVNDMTNTNGQQGINNIDAANEEIQRATFDPGVTDSSGTTIYVSTGDVTETFGEAFAAAPIVLMGGSTATFLQVPIIKGITTTDFDSRNLGPSNAEDSSVQGYVALGD